MAFQPVPNTASFVLRFIENTTGLFIGSNQLHFEAITPPITQATLDLATETLRDSIDAQFVPLITNGTVFAGVTGTDLTTAMAPQSVALSGTQGAIVSPRLPTNVTIAVKFLTGATGRSRRGRVFWNGLAESQVAGNNVDPALLGFIVGSFGEIQDDMLAIGWQFVVVSRVQEKVKLPAGIPYPVTAVTFTDSRVDTMKGRLRF